jgi:large subunit ribosomal protein L4
MELPVRNTKGDVVETAELDEAVFGVAMNAALVHQALVMYRLSARQGTHSTKTRAQVSGGGRKPWAQKYTGRARQGSIRSPQWRHGGIVFGPLPRDHRVAMPRRMRHLALKCVLSEKVRTDKLVLLDSFGITEPDTKAMISILENLNTQSSTLIVTGEPEQGVVLSSRNLQKVWTLPVSLINAHQLLKRDWVIMTLEAARKAEELWAVERPKRRVEELLIQT